MASEDALERRAAQRELRADLLFSEPDSGWALRLALMTRNLALDTDRAEVASAVAEVAAVHGISAGVVGGETPTSAATARIKRSTRL